MQKVMDEGSHHFEWIHTRRTGEDFWTDLVLTSLLFDGHRIIHGAVRDISAQKMLEEEISKERETVHNRTEQLEVQTSKAVHASQAKSMFLANMSHELRTPLNSIIGMTAMAIDTELDKEQKEMIFTAHQASGMLLEIVNDILDISKIESGQMVLENIGFDFTIIFDRIVTTLRSLASQRGNLLTGNIIGGELPYVIGDPVRISSVLTNLISNALKYTKEGTVTVTVSYEEKSEGIINIHCEVVDTGIGISKAKQDTVFETFSQAESSTTRNYGGTGLGLSISRQLVEMMGGEIGVTSKEGQGSTFWFNIPLGKTDAIDMEEQDAAVAVASYSADQTLPYEKVKMLVAEDHALNQIFLKKLLSKWGISNVTFVESGKEALEAVQANNFDVILMDCHMPEMNGYDATRAIRNLDDDNIKDIPIVALTANVIAGTKEKCLEAGMDLYATKPIESKRLKNILKNWIKFETDTGKEKIPESEEEQKRVIPVNMSILEEYSDTVEEANEFIDIFISLTDESLSALEKSCEDEENEAWLEAAHKIQGGAGIIGAFNLSDICNSAQNVDLILVKGKAKLFKEIHNEYYDVKDYLINKYIYKK
ncbi:MAG TPA: response regulator, partial [Gammaproteobacteria bacterium]|nr:response regulator [Gammaproteobacteria bacterium]